MLRKVAGCGFAAILPFIAATALLTPRPVTVALPDDSETDNATLAPPTVDQDEQQREGVTDLFGNPVTDAVARYKFDATGSLYELHSPNTEVPRLRPPKT